MPPDVPRASPERLAEVPEIAALEILGCTADTAARSLLAASPELQERDFLTEQAGVTPLLCLGAAVLSAIDVLTVAVERYRAHVDRLASLRQRETEHHDF